MARLIEVNQLILARNLVDTSSEIIPLQVLNPTDYPCTLYKDTGSNVEALHIWQNNMALCQECEKGGSHTDALLNPDECLQLAQLLTDFADVFAFSFDDLQSAT